MNATLPSMSCMSASGWKQMLAPASTSRQAPVIHPERTNMAQECNQAAMTPAVPATDSNHAIAPELNAPIQVHKGREWRGGTRLVAEDRASPRAQSRCGKPAAPDGRYRTALLRGLWTHARGGYYHDGRFATLADVIGHYDTTSDIAMQKPLTEGAGAGRDPATVVSTMSQKGKTHDPQPRSHSP